MCAQILGLIELPENAEAISKSLAQSGHKIVVTTTFTQAKVVLARSRVDLIISEVHLQNGGSVFDFLMWIRRDPATNKTPFVLFSSQRSDTARYLEDGIRITARTLGATKYIVMDSFDTNDFCEQIDSLLPKKDESCDAEIPQAPPQT